MNRIKRTGALLVAIALILGVVIQSGVGGVLANNMDAAEQSGSVTEQTAQVTQPVTEAVTEPVTAPATEPITEAVTEPVTEPITEAVTEPTAEAVTEPTTLPDGEAQTTEPTSETDGQLTDVTTDVTTDDGGDVLPEINIYQQLMSCGSLAEMEALLFAEENAAAVAMLTQEERILISARIEELCAQSAQPTEAEIILKDRLLAKLNENIIAICPECGGLGAAHNEGCSAYIPPCTCGSLDGIHAEDCPAYVPVCTCGSLDGIHAEDCPAYVPICTCGSLDGVHAEDCPAYVPICTCGSLDGIHAEDCPAYVAEDEVYIWSELTDFELAMWLMDEANAEAVKAILADETTEEYAELTMRIDAILGMGDDLLAEQLMAYLTALVEMDGAETLATDETIYFDLAAGNVEIGKVVNGAKTYSGWVYVMIDGTPTKKEVTDVHVDTNKYYIYQSNPKAAEDSPTHPNNTGYIDEAAYIAKAGCRVPTYNRVKITVDGVEKNWTDYITNNKDVYAVSTNWDTAAAAAGVGRTSTNNYITFASESNYTANVIIDNIWSIYWDTLKDWRTTGGIGANLKNKNIDCENVNIYLSMKGDNRVGCVHYSAGVGRGNSINFINGDSDEMPGSITVADFKSNWNGNHWNAVIGGADSSPGVADISDGIVINSGYIYAGATYEDNCTAIGGGGNNYGGVTITGGTVTAVAATTGTAIGGGIGWSGEGGNARVDISGGTIYAYNLGIKTGTSSHGIVLDGYTKYVPAAAIGGGSSQDSSGNKSTIVNISGGTVYAQSAGGAAIGGGGSSKKLGGGATINISGGTIIAKSTTAEFKGSTIPAGVSIGGGTGNEGGGSVKLTITKEKGNPILRTGSIGGGITTGTGNIGSANVTISGGDITGQVIMKGGPGAQCTFTMSDGIIHGTNVVTGNTITDITDPQPDVLISYKEKNGGAVWMDDENGKTTITGGTISGCTAQKGGAVYMKGGTFTMTGGKLTGNNAVKNDTGTPEVEPTAESTPDENAASGWGGAVCVEGGSVTIRDGDFSEPDTPTKGPSVSDSGQDTHGTRISSNTAVYGGGIYVSGGNVNIHGGIVEKNIASSYGGGVYLTSDGSADGNTSEVVLDRGHILENTAIDGGGVYLPNGNFTVDCRYHNAEMSYGKHTIHGGEIANNKATRNGGGLYMKNSPNLEIGMIHDNTAGESGGGVCIQGCELKLTFFDRQFYGNEAKHGGGVAVLGGNFYLGAKLEDELPSDDPNADPYDKPENIRMGMVGMTDGVPMPLADANPEDGGTDAGGAEVPDLQESYYNVAENGGGVYVSGGNVYIYHGYIWGNKANKGGGVYLDKVPNTPESTPEAAAEGSQEGTPEGGDESVGKFVMDHPEAVISQNTANDGAGIYLFTAPELLQGNIAQNVATNNGGGIYIDDCPVILKPTGTVNIANNEARNGAGLYIAGTQTSVEPSETADNGEVYDAVSRATTNHRIGLKLDDSAGAIVFANNVANKATGSGGAVCISIGHFYLESDKVRIIGNEAFNGGGVAVLNGYFRMTKGAIGESGDETQPEMEEHTRANSATNGGGVYVSAGTADIVGGHIEYNTAQYGGGVYVTGDTSAEGGKSGELNLISGTLSNNTATVDGGGFYVKDGNFTMGAAITDAPLGEVPAAPLAEGGAASSEAIVANNTAAAHGGGGYVAGNFEMLSGRIGGVGGTNSANDGGGIYVTDGNVTVVYGDIEHNTAKNDGGGFYISAESKRCEVIMLSGKLNNNTAGHNGGGMAVVSVTQEGANTHPIDVKIGCLLDHNVTDGAPIYSIDYTDDYSTYGGKGKHRDCPEVKDNSSQEVGGGFYMSSAGSTLSFYCVEEAGNTAKDSSKNCWGMDVVDGTVSIGDNQYHNHHSHETGYEKDKPRGYINMSSTILVTGGQVDIYGDMDNPYFSKEITVDIEDKNTDHFLDHRHAYEDKKYYKVHYFENFEGAGQYKEFTYSQDNCNIIIQGALYSHPGYTIKGWYTKPIQEVGDQGHDFYEVGKTYDLSDDQSVPQMGDHPIGCTICGENIADEYLLILYAIWDQNVYYVDFEANVPNGVAYTGSMEQQQHAYNTAASLTPNAFKRPGYDFAGWSLYSYKNAKKDTDGKVIEGEGEAYLYKDKELVKNLTDKLGDTVTLYARWTKCEHTDPERWSYTTNLECDTLIRNCSCGGQTLTAALSAVDTVYNGIDQPATLVLSDADAWGTDILEVVYESKWLTGDVLHIGQTGGPQLSDTLKQPVHAGEYTASITKTDTKGNKTITSVKYTIDKAEQEPPEKPSYSVDGDNKAKLFVNKVAYDPKTLPDGSSANAKYQASYYDNGTMHSTTPKPSNGSEKIEINLPAAYTNYLVEVFYEETQDYKPSAIVRADAVYYYGSVTVKVICDEGITAKLSEPGADVDAETDITNNGLTLTLSLDNDYYLVHNGYDVNNIMVVGDVEKKCTKSYDAATGEYKFTSIEANSELTITVGTTRKKTTFDQKVAPGQVFRAINSTEATISNDSAFTAAFKLTNFDPYRKINDSDPSTPGVEYGAYTALNLTFDRAIPANTTIIMLDIKKDGTKEYWYYRVTADTGISQIPLTDFTEMGGTGVNYELPIPTGSGYVDLNYQFIVDFSQCEKDKLLSSNLKMSLVAEKATTLGEHAQDIKPAVEVTMSPSSFQLTKDPSAEPTMTHTFECKYTKDTDAKASKWENRTSALVLVPAAGVTLPPDARLKAEITGSGAETTYITQSVDKKFIVPMSLLKDSETVKLTLESSLLPVAQTNYKLSAQWWVSQSKAGKSPLDGNKADAYVASTVDVTFGYPAKTQLSLKPVGTQRVLTARDTLKLEVKIENMKGYNITATIEGKGRDDVYSSTAKSENKYIESDYSGDHYDLNMGMAGLQPGSYRVWFAVRHGENQNGAVVLQVPYYFVISD